MFAQTLAFPVADSELFYLSSELILLNKGPLGLIIQRKNHMQLPSRLLVTDITLSDKHFEEVLPNA